MLPSEKVYFEMIKEALSMSKLPFLTRSERDIQSPENTTLYPDWTNLDEGVPGWMFSILLPRISSWVNSKQIKGSPCLPKLSFQSLPYLSYFGFVASGCIIDSIGTLAGPLDIPRPDSYNRRRVIDTLTKMQPSLNIPKQQPH